MKTKSNLVISKGITPLKYLLLCVFIVYKHLLYFVDTVVHIVYVYYVGSCIT